LSWRTVLNKRDAYRRAFAGFAVDAVAAFDASDVSRLMADAGIIRNRAKIESAIGNALAVQRLREDCSLDEYLWSFVDGRPTDNRVASVSELPASTPVSDRMSKDMRRRGFRFTGTTICYSLMQACGLVNDHLVGCYRYEAIRRAE
jgi:DNA-3-methyladenine glycosylase I